MKLRRKEASEVFGLSFLDVISCGFGAMLSLLILGKESITEIIMPVVEPSVPLLPVEVEQTKYESLATKLAELQDYQESLQSRLAETEDSLRTILARSPSEVIPSFQSEESGRAGSMESIYAGGIPVGASHIIFIVDTSGSMQVQWSIVLDTVENILASHPVVDGIQFMDDNGGYLIEGYAGLWIPDTRAARDRAFDKIRTWTSISNSSPAEGLEVALKTYAKDDIDLAIYVLGDDYFGESFDKVLAVVDRWNVDSNGKRIAAIHGIGFPWGVGDRFGTLLREIGLRNNGVFIGL